MKSGTGQLSAGVLGIALMAGIPAHAFVIDDGVPIGGETYYQNTADWWQWALSYPSSSSPMLDTDGSRAYLGDQGTAFFLAGSFVGSPMTRTFDLPPGKTLFFPVANNISFQTLPWNEPGGDTEASLRQGAEPTNVSAYWASLDGVPIGDQATRQKSPLFTLQSPLLAEWGYCFPAACPSGYTGYAVTDGYWLTLQPLAPGPHSLKFGALFTDGTSLDITANVNVVPEPGTYALMLGGLGLVGWLARRRRVAP